MIKLDFNLQQEYHIKGNPNMAICDIRSSRIHYHFWYIQANWHPTFLSMLIMNPSRFITFMIHLQFDYDKSCSLSLIQPLILLCIIKENNDIFLELESQTTKIVKSKQSNQNKDKSLLPLENATKPYTHATPIFFSFPHFYHQRSTFAHGE